MPAPAAARWAPALLLVLRAVVARGLRAEVNIHYPEKDSAVEHCGFRFQVATSFSEPIRPVDARQSGEDLFTATLELPDVFLYRQTVIAVLADFSEDQLASAGCQRVCAGIGKQGQMVQLGPHARTRALGLRNRIDLWPSFCRGTGDWASVNTTFYSEALDRHVHIVARLPAESLENRQPRPGHLLPPIMFRFNAEWYWPHADSYVQWHGLMVNGVLQPFAVAEVYVEGVATRSWDVEPILSTQPLRLRCGPCDPDMQFICDRWEESAADYYAGGNHSFGIAAAFFGELERHAMAPLRSALPPSSDGEEARLGAWGYCIGGLAAWNALAWRPGAFSLAYLGSPAVDFDCGAPLAAVENFSWPPGSPPKVYIDSGAVEDTEAGRQARLLFHRLQRKGLVDGRDVFYQEAAFGTHQHSALLRRALRGLLVLFGAGNAARVAYAPADHEVLVDAHPASLTQQLERDVNSTVRWSTVTPLSCALIIILAFICGRLSSGFGKRWPANRFQPFLADNA